MSLNNLKKGSISQPFFIEETYSLIKFMNLSLSLSLFDKTVSNKLENLWASS